MRVDGGRALSEEFAKGRDGGASSDVKEGRTICSFSKFARVSAEVIDIALGRESWWCYSGRVLRPEYASAVRRR